MIPSVAIREVTSLNQRLETRYYSEALSTSTSPISELILGQGSRLKVIGKVLCKDSEGDFVLLVSQNREGVVHRYGVALSDYERLEDEWDPAKITISSERKRLGKNVQMAIRDLRTFERAYGLGKYKEKDDAEQYT